MVPLQLQPESHVPLYVQIRDQLRALVSSGELRAGDRIPASRELAGQLGVHRTTVANAYAELEADGLIRGHVGRGTFILETQAPGRISPPPPPHNGQAGVRWESLFADERGEEALSRLCPTTLPNAISFLNARPADEMFPVEEFRNCCNAVLRRDGKTILQFGSADGYAPLKDTVRDLLRRGGIQAAEDEILITDGCQQSLDLLCKAFLRPGDTVILENPAYPGAIAIFSGARVRCVGVPVQNGVNGGEPGMDIGALEAALLQNRVKLIITTPDFQNPTGTTMPMAARRRLLEVAARHQVPVVEDHIYGGLWARGKKIPSLKALDRAGVVIHVDSFSKVAFPGLRVGWLVAPKNVVDRMRLVKQAADLHTDNLSQAALAEFVKRGGFEKHLARMRKIYATRLAAMEEALERHMPEGVEWARVEGGMSVWLILPPGFDASELLIHVRERGVLFAPGRYFYFQQPQPNTLRLAFAALDEKKIGRGVTILGEVLRMEMRKRERGARREFRGSVALV